MEICENQILFPTNGVTILWWNQNCSMNDKCVLIPVDLSFQCDREGVDVQVSTPIFKSVRE